MSIVVGCDPGLTGGVAVLDRNGLRALFAVPTMLIPGAGPKTKVKKKVDGRAFCSLLLKHCPAADGKPTFVVEAVGTMGGANNAVQTQGSLLRSLGALETVAECLSWPVVYAPPQTWKRFYGLIDPNLKDTQRKAKALKTARDLYPDAALPLASDHNKAEAILLARWWYRHNVDAVETEEEGAF